MPTIQERVETLEHELRGIGEIIKMESRLNETRFKALFADIDVLKRDVSTIKAQMEALPRVIAEMVAPQGRRKKPSK